jgi:enediyne biosynthesis protein E7
MHVEPRPVGGGQPLAAPRIGPPPARWPWLGIDHLLRIRGDQLAFYCEMRDRHGDVVRLQLGPHRAWMLFHPFHIEAVLTREWGAFIRFERLMRVLRQWNGDSLLLAEGPEWRERRRKVMPAFQTRRMPAYGAMVVEHARALTGCWRKQLDRQDCITVDIDAAMARLTLDIAAATLFGAEPLANGDELAAAVQVLSDTAFHESTVPWALPGWLPLPSKRRKRWAMHVLDGTVRGLVERRLQSLRRAPDRDDGDLLSMLVQQHAGDANAIRNDSVSLLIAGHETTGALLSWLLACLARYPDQLRLVQAELRTVLRGRPPAISDLRALPCLAAAMGETLRLYPPAYALFMRRAQRAVTIGEVRIGPGDNVLIAPYALHRDARWFEAPETFAPQRFRGPPTWPQYAYLPFGAGPRVCVGESFAMMEACLAAATILQSFEPLPLTAMPEPSAKFSLRPRGGLAMAWRPMPMQGGAIRP